jgi:predicted NBD/HSP70 family sugar kinase
VTTRSAELLALVHGDPGITRAAAARALGVGTGAAAELVARLCQAELLAEAPAAPSGARGRPTTVLLPHPAGPLILATAITHESWRVEAVELGGRRLSVREGLHPGTGPADRVLPVIAAAAGELREAYAKRVRGIGVAAPGTVSRDRRLDASGLDWHDIDLTRLWQIDRARGWEKADVFLAGNDASLAASAESSRGAAVGAHVALHLRVESGLGGALVEDGKVLVGALGTAGEFGHMPFGDPAITCPCGARGCWGTAVDGSALARLLGHSPPADPITYARKVIHSERDPERAATRTVASALGRGIAGLVNGLDPDLVTLGGLGVDLLGVAGEQIRTAYRAGLMGFRRADPPPVIAAALGDEGPLLGAAEEAWAALLPKLG